MFAFFIASLFANDAADKPSTAPAVTESARADMPEPASAGQPEPAEVAPIEVPTDDAEQLAAAAERANNERYSVYCLSLWDGSHDRFVESVKEAINDPDSFEHDETRTWPVNAEGRNTIVMNFRARNALGGMVRVKAAGSFNNDPCSDVRIDLIE